MLFIVNRRLPPSTVCSQLAGRSHAKLAGSLLVHVWVTYFITVRGNPMAPVCEMAVCKTMRSRWHTGFGVPKRRRPALPSSGLDTLAKAGLPCE